MKQLNYLFREFQLQCIVRFEDSTPDVHVRMLRLSELTMRNLN